MCISVGTGPGYWSGGHGGPSGDLGFGRGGGPVALEYMVEVLLEKVGIMKVADLV